MALSMDVLPTLAKLSRADLPADRPVDGLDIWPLLSGAEGAKTPHDAFYYYWGKELQAVRGGKWKLHLAHTYTKPDPAGAAGQPGKYATLKVGPSLYDLENDPGEKKDVAAGHPNVVKHLEELADKARKDLGDSLTHREGKNVRQPGKLAEGGK